MHRTCVLMAMPSVVRADVCVRRPTTRTTHDAVSVYSLHHGLRGSRLVRGLRCMRVCVCAYSTSPQSTSSSRIVPTFCIRPVQQMVAFCCHRFDGVSHQTAQHHDIVGCVWSGWVYCSKCTKHLKGLWRADLLLKTF